VPVADVAGSNPFDGENYLFTLTVRIVFLYVYLPACLPCLPAVPSVPACLPVCVPILQK
jgi:hypothetical protein